MKKKLAMIFATCITLSLTIGCTVFGAENSTEEAKQEYDRRIEARKEKSEKQFNIAKVVTVNENAIVVTLAEKPELPEGEEGERPERPPMPEGEEERPRHDKLEKELNFSEEETEIVLNENIEIHIRGGEQESEQGSIEDIQPDDVIMIDYDEDGETVKGIFIKKQKE